MLNKHDYRYRNYLKLERKMDEVYRKLRSVPWVPLKNPYKDGWNIFYDLRKDISLRRDAGIIKLAVLHGYRTLFTRNESHVKAIRAGKTSVKAKKGKTVNLCPDKTKLSEKSYNELPDNIRHYFQLDELDEAYIKWKAKYYKICLPNYWLQLRVKSRIITHIQKKGGALEAEYEFLCDQYRSYFDLGINYSKCFPAYKDRAKVRSAIQKFKHGNADDIQIEKIPMEYEY
jgi:hypothetical protein